MSELLAGKFLIASKHLRDPNFYKTVVLMVEHSQTGAMGLIVNRPSQMPIAKALETHFDLPDNAAVVYTGGPVEETVLFILHDSSKFGGQESPVVPGLYVGSDAEVFERVLQQMADGEPSVRFRVYAGCSGWSPGQLEGEISRGDWLTVPATVAAIFQEDPYTLWDELTREAGPLPGLLPPGDGRAEWN